MADVSQRLYLAGPMSGIPQHNYPLFNRVAKMLREQGHEVFNPAENQDDGARRSRAYYMRLDIPALLACDALVALPDWEGSRGANLEMWIAIDLEMPVYECVIRDDHVLLDVLRGLDVGALPFADGVQSLVRSEVASATQPVGMDG